MKIKQCAALLMAATMAAVSLVGCGGSDAASGSGATAASGDTIVVDFWTAPQQVQYNLWESRAQAFNATGTQVNGKTVMIIPMCISIWAIFMYINYFKTVPGAVFEAARIDGAGDLRILWSIALPVTKSVSTIVFLSIFMQRWSELMWDMLISPDIKMQTLNVLISTQFKPMGAFPGPMYAASVILTLPIIILFLCFSKYFKEGISFMLK